MSIFAAFGAAPSNLTVPLTVATVAGSIGAAAGAVAAGSAGAFEDCSVFSFLLHAARISNAPRAAVPMVIFLFLFIMSSLSVSFELFLVSFRARRDAMATRSF